MRSNAKHAAHSDHALEQAVLAVRRGKLQIDASDPVDRLQSALLSTGHRLTTADNTRQMMQDAAMLAAEAIEVDYGGVAERIVGQQGISYWLRRTDGEGSLTAKMPNDSMAHFAANAGHPIISTDLGSESRFRDRFLNEIGVRSAVACPIAVGKRTFGIIGTYNRRQRFFHRNDVFFIEAIGQHVAASLQTRKAEQQVESELRKQSTLLDTIDAIVLELEPDGHIRAFNRALRQAVDMPADRLLGAPLWRVLLVPEEVGKMQDALRRLQQGESPLAIESQIVTGAGERLRVRWSFAAIYDGEGGIESLLGIGQLGDRQHPSAAPVAKSPPPDAKEQPFEQLNGGIFHNRRARPRRAFPYYQLIAPLKGNRLPAPSAFEKVLCRDISAGGFSYLIDEEPKHQRLVVAFGTEPHLTYLAATVVHVSQVEIDDRRQYAVGCRYTGRIDY